MATMHISLPDTLKDFVDSQVHTSGYSTSSEYIQELIQEDQRRTIERKLAGMLHEGIESGPPEVADAAYWEALRREVESNT